MTRSTVQTLIAVAILLIVAGGYFMLRTAQTASKIPTSSNSYPASDAVLTNPLMGFAPAADCPDEVGDNTLVYIGVRWADLEPEEGKFDFSGLEERQNLARWRAAGKHAVLRFLCDVPGSEPHLDIPQWLYDKISGDGTKYVYDSLRGFSPNYKNPTLIEYHRRAIEALGRYFSADTFVSYVELGSLGHWGEWHVNYDAGISRIPNASIREQYIAPYLSSFSNVKFLMRRPFQAAAQYGFGLYDDMAGHTESTEEWLGWINNGGDYNQTEERSALVPMPDAWKTAPIGGELNSTLSMEYMLRFHTDETLSLLTRSHTTFLGPKIATVATSPTCTEGIDQLRKTIGYRIRIESSKISKSFFTNAISVKLAWINDGIAPLYWNWPVSLYLLDAANSVVGTIPVDFKLTTLFPGKPQSTTTAFPWKPEYDHAVTLAIGVSDPMTNSPAILLAMETKRIGAMSILQTFKES